jgi:hypothetical protein
LQIRPGAKVLYLGAASGSSVSHVSDIVGPEGVVYAVEFSHRSGRDLIGMAKKRTNVIRECGATLFARGFASIPVPPRTIHRSNFDSHPYMFLVVSAVSSRRTHLCNHSSPRLCLDPYQFPSAHSSFPLTDRRPLRVAPAVSLAVSLCTHVRLRRALVLARSR